MPITILDGIVIGVALFSAVLAMVRGFSREVLSVASWVGAAAAAYFLYPVLLPYAKDYTTSDTVPMVGSAAAVFLVALIVISFITMRIADFIIDSRIGALDRTLGFVFGAGRGLLLAVIGYLFFTALVPEKMQPPWAKDAKAKPMLEETGRSLIAMLPQDVNADFIKNLLKKPAGETAPEAPAEEPRSPATPAPVAPAPARP